MAKSVGVLGSRAGLQWLYQDDFSELLADRQASVANLADKVRLAGKQLNDLILAQSKFAEPVLQFRGSAQLFNTHSNPGFDAV